MTSSTRIAGLLLVLSCIALLFTTIDYVSTIATFEGKDEATAAERAAFFAGVQAHLARGWMIEVIAVALLAVAALSLSHRAGRVGWFLAATGAAFTAPMYAVLRGGLGKIFEQEELNVELYEAINGIAAETFFIGQGLMMLGLGAAMLLEIAQQPRALPRPVLAVGGSFGVLSGVIFVLVHVDIVGTYMFAGLFGLVTLAFTALFGARLIVKPD